MSHNQSPFVVATTDPLHTSPHPPVMGSSPLPSPSSPSPVIMTAHLDPPTSQVKGHRRSASDACQRRQQFAESPQGSVHAADTLNNGAPGTASAANAAAPAARDAAVRPTDSQPGSKETAVGNPSEACTNGGPASAHSTGTAGHTGAHDKSLHDELQGVEMRRRQRPLRQAQSDVPISMTTSEHQRCSQSLSDAKEHAYARLMTELSKAQRELRLRDEECEKLGMLRTQMEHEIDELSAALFEEANKMVQDAHVKRMNAEKRLEDANLQIDILQSEVSALKQLVVTSTPSSPNRHLHPQISQAPSPRKDKDKGSKPFWRSHRRSTSHHQFTQEAREQAEQQQHSAAKVKESFSYSAGSGQGSVGEDWRMDTVCFDEFQRWKLQPSITCTASAFLSRVLHEDIQPCLNFHNKQLADRVLQCVEHNSLTIEPIPGDSSFPRKCSLTDMHKLCNYKIKLEEDGDWHSISQLCRNRIAAVCDFYTYIRYICQGLVKSSDKDMFQEIVRLRLQMATARLGC